MLRVKGKLILLTSQQGGMERDGFSGMSPSFCVNGELIMCFIHTGDHGSLIERGRATDAIIELPYGEHYLEHIKPGCRYTIHYASKLLGDVLISDIAP